MTRCCSGFSSIVTQPSFVSKPGLFPAALTLPCRPCRRQPRQGPESATRWPDEFVPPDWRGSPFPATPFQGPHPCPEFVNGTYICGKRARSDCQSQTARPRRMCRRAGLPSLPFTVAHRWTRLSLPTPLSFHWHERTHRRERPAAWFHPSNPTYARLGTLCKARKRHQRRLLSRGFV